MNGLLLPHRDLDLSASAPMSGAMMMPDNGLFRAYDQYSVLDPGHDSCRQSLIDCVLEVLRTQRSTLVMSCSSSSLVQVDMVYNLAAHQSRAFI